MKKVVLMLLGVAATINVMAVDYTAKAKVTISSTSGYECELTLRQADTYGALSGTEMYMSGMEVAIYALNGTTPLQIAKASDLTDVKLGLKTDATTSYTITVSAVEGTETLYIWDADSASYALTAGASYTFAAAANATDEARFVIKKAPLPTAPEFCFNYNKLTVNAYTGKSLVIKQGATEIVNIPALPIVYEKDLSGYTGRLVVTLDGVDYQIDANPTLD